MAGIGWSIVFVILFFKYQYHSESFPAYPDKETSEEETSSTEKIAFRTQINELKKLGFSFKAGVTEKHLLGDRTREEYEEEPYLPLLIALGSVVDKKGNAISNDIHYFDSEFDGVGSYKIYLERLGALSKGYYKFRNIVQTEDEMEGVSKLTFLFDRERVRWEFPHQDGYLDSDFWKKFGELVGNGKREKSFYLIETKDQSYLIVYLKKEYRSALETLTKSKVVLLEEVDF